MRRRLLAFVIAFVLAAGALLSFAQPAQAKKIWPLVGCDSFLEWPCPGPAL